MMTEARKIHRKFMRRRIPEYDWQKFFEQLNDACGGWKTSLHATDENGKNSFEQSPLAALVFIEQNGQTLIELIAGDSLENHRTYKIFEPQKIILIKGENISVLIKDSRHVKTSISFVQPNFEADFSVEVSNRSLFGLKPAAHFL